MNLARFLSDQWELDAPHIFDDFIPDNVTGLWTDTLTGVGTAAVGDEDSGVVTLTPSDGTVADNDEVYRASANAVFRLLANRELYAKARLQWVETAAGIYNVGFGFVSGVGTNVLVDNGGGMRTTGAVIAIYKVDGESVWRCVSRNGSTFTVSQSNKAAVGATWYVPEIIIKDWDGVSQEVSFKVDGEYLRDTNTNVPISHRVPLAAAAQMQLWMGAKLGAVTNNDTTKVDFVLGVQTR